MSNWCVDINLETFHLIGHYYVGVLFAEQDTSDRGFRILR